MIQIDDLLDALRKQLARYSLVESLFVVHSYMQYLQFNQPMPKLIEIDPAVAAKMGYERNCYEWELDLLSRQLLQHAPVAGIFSLTRWGEFANTLNLLKQLDNAISQRAGKLIDDNIFLEVGRIAYRQFPWQERPNSWRLARYYKIFGNSAVDAIVNAEIKFYVQESSIYWDWPLRGTFVRSSAIRTQSVLRQSIFPKRSSVGSCNGSRSRCPSCQSWLRLLNSATKTSYIHRIRFEYFLSFTSGWVAVIT